MMGQPIVARSHRHPPGGQETEKDLNNPRRGLSPGHCGPQIADHAAAEALHPVRSDPNEAERRAELRARPRVVSRQATDSASGGRLAPQLLQRCSMKRTHVELVEVPKDGASTTLRRGTGGRYIP